VNIITHLLASWTASEFSGVDEKRDRMLVAWAGVSPDLDGLGVLVDLSARAFGLEDPMLYGRFHHALLHGLPGALVLSAIAAGLSRQRARTFGWAFAIVHLHLLCDLVGSRGPEPDDIWPIPYLAPFTEMWTLSWSHQWALNAWPNIAFTLVLLVLAFMRAAKNGSSPVAMFSERANAVFAETVRARLRSGRGRD
jgi:hypothetical protein